MSERKLIDIYKPIRTVGGKRKVICYRKNNLLTGYIVEGDPSPQPYWWTLYGGLYHVRHSLDIENYEEETEMKEEQHYTRYLITNAWGRGSSNIGLTSLEEARAKAKEIMSPDWDKNRDQVTIYQAIENVEVKPSPSYTITALYRTGPDHQ